MSRFCPKSRPAANGPPRLLVRLSRPAAVFIVASDMAEERALRPLARRLAFAVNSELERWAALEMSS